MFQREAITRLRQWRESKGRKPLILRGARQVGKTTLVKAFAKEYVIFLELNLEKELDRQLFEDHHDVHELIRAIFMHKCVTIKDVPTLLFIDEIQYSKKAVAILRYFYEEANHIHVIAAGSLLETVIDVRKISFPVAETRMPLMQNFRKRPKLIWLDTGLVNYMAGIQKEVFSVKDIQDIWRGRIAEHIVAQELLTLDDSLLTRRHFWRRDKHGSEAEVDFVYPYQGLAIPIEVKSGHNAKLKSLHMFMDEAPHNIAVRIWSQPFSTDEVITPNSKKFRLINVPFYYVSVLEKVLDKLT